MRLDGQADIQIAGRTAPRAHLTLTGDAHINAIIHARRNIHRDAAVIAHTPLSPAGRAGRRNHFALAPAAVTDHHIDKLPENRLLDLANLAGALAGRTALRLRARLRAAAPAGGAVLPARHLDLFLAAEHSLLKGDSQFKANIRATLAARPACLCRIATKKLLEDVRKARAKAIAAKVTICARAYAGMPETVIHLPFLSVAEDFIRFVNLLEARLSPFFFVAVRVKLKRQLAERLFDLFLA